MLRGRISGPLSDVRGTSRLVWFGRPLGRSLKPAVGKGDWEKVVGVRLHCIALHSLLLRFERL